MKKITLESLNISSEEFTILYNTKQFSEISKILNISSDTIRTIAKSLNLKRKRIFKEFKPKINREDIIKSRSLPSGEDYKSLGLTAHSYYKHLKYYNLDRKDSKIYKQGNPRIKYIDIEKLKESINMTRSDACSFLNVSPTKYLQLLKEFKIYDERSLKFEVLDYFDNDDKAKEELSKGYSYLKEKYNLSEDIARRFCKKLNIQKPKSKYEQEILDIFKDFNPIHNFRKLIPNKEIDIFFPDYNFGIEFDGDYWHSYPSPGIKSPSDLMKKQKYKTKYINENYPEVQLFTIREHEWIEKKDIWISIIKNKFKSNKRIFARKCVIKEIDTKTAKDFIDNNHLQGYSNSSIKIGLYYNDDEIVSVMTFGRSRFNEDSLELIRYSTKREINVVGGASKLFKYFIRKYSPKKIISYADLRYSKGNLYEMLGFQKISETQDYGYLKCGIFYSRYKVMKKNLPNFLNDYDPSLSGPENLFKNGFRMICGVGQSKYEYKCI